MTVRFSDLLATLAGGRTDVLAVVPGARPKFVAMGAVVLGTAGMAALSAGFAVGMALGASLPAAIAIGMYVAARRAYRAGAMPRRLLTLAFCVGLGIIAQAVIGGVIGALGSDLFD